MKIDLQNNLGQDSDSQIKSHKSNKTINSIKETKEIKEINEKSQKKYINSPDFYIGIYRKKYFPQYFLTDNVEIYNKTIKLVDDMDSRNLQLSREIYYSGFEQEILNSIKHSADKQESEIQSPTSII